MESNEAAFLAKLQATFKIEAEEHLKNLNAGLLSLEKTRTTPAPFNLLETVFREAHSLKGAARSVNHQDIQIVSHAMENVLSALKQQHIVPSPEMFDTLYTCIDLIGKILDGGSKAESKQLLNNMIQRLDGLLEASVIHPLENEVSPPPNCKSRRNNRPSKASSKHRNCRAFKRRGSC